MKHTNEVIFSLRTCVAACLARESARESLSGCDSRWQSLEVRRLHIVKCRLSRSLENFLVEILVEMLQLWLSATRLLVVAE